MRTEKHVDKIKMHFIIFLDINQFSYVSLADYIPIQPTLFMLDVMLLLTRYIEKYNFV